MKTARDLLDERAKEHYMKSSSLGASPFGLDGIPYSRRNAIVRLMHEYAEQVATEALRIAAEQAEAYLDENDNPLVSKGSITSVDIKAIMK